MPGDPLFGLGRCGKIYSDKKSGKNALRPELKACHAFLDAGDTLVFPSLDRYGRSLQDLINMVTELRERGIGFTSLHESLDTRPPADGSSSRLRRLGGVHPRTHRAGHPRGPGRRTCPRPGRSFRILIREGALYALTCPPELMAAQLDRLVSVIGIDAVDSASSPSPPNCVAARSRLLDLRPALFVIETLSTKMWLDDEENLALCERSWDWLAAPVTGGSLAPPVGERRQV
ncbi:Scr1 family TA system antitoxin-like transcriptional regulator [Leifsonia sp. NPDC102414]|uniref:Scr1 family TA system antitoxin-like transcriptional regulator n=1 Tax=Leifsonia sp. NPDC102414 TaxID=3364124 RepID=UPI0038229C75